MAKEKEWVEAVADWIRSEGQLMELEGVPVRVGSGARLPYSYNAFELEANEELRSRSAQNPTDLLLYDQLDDKWWVPRVVIECILGEVTQYNALSLSSRAARHKHVHSYLRYGILISGNNLFSVPPVRMFRHGDRFDFIVSWSDEKASVEEWDLFIGIVKEEVLRSRFIQELFAANQDPNKYSLMHRQLAFK